MQNYYWRGLKYCIISKNDATTKNCHMSKALTTLVRELRLKDAWFVKNKKVEFTYISSVWYGRSNKIQIVNIFISAILNHLRI